MIKFNELRITDDGKYLLIDAEVIDTEPNIRINNVLIDTQDTYKAGAPSNNTVYSQDYNDVYLNYVCGKIEEPDGAIIYEDNTKDVKLYSTKGDTTINKVQYKFSVKDLNSKFTDGDFNHCMLFVYVQVKGYPSESTPCSDDREYILGTVVNLQSMYDIIMSDVREIDDKCRLPMNFINKMLAYNAIDLSIKTGNYPLAIKYWNKVFRNNTTSTDIKSCNCHG